MCNTFAVYFQIFATFGYKKVKNSDYFKISALYFKIYGLYFSPFQIAEKQCLEKGLK